MSKKIAEGTGLARARRQGRLGRVHEGPGPGTRAGAHDGRAGHRRGRHAPSRCSPTWTTPLGLTAGNALEVRESVEVLAGGGPADVVELTVALAREMLAAAGRPTRTPAAALADGRAMDVWRAMIAAQGGDPDAPLPGRARDRAGARGVRRRADDARRVRRRRRRVAARRGPRPQGGPGAGRARASRSTRGRATRVRAGQPLLTLHTDTPERFGRAREALAGRRRRRARAARPVAPRPLVIDRIAA